MSFKKATLEKTKGHTKTACVHYSKPVRGFSIFLAALMSLLTLLAAPTVTQAQTTSTAPYLDAKGFTVFTATPITSGTCAAGTANGTCIFYVSDTDGNDCNDGSSSVANRTGCGAGPFKSISAGIRKLYTLNGKPTWLLLKKGDTFTDQVLANYPTSCCFAGFGFSADQPMVLSSYDPANPTVPNPGTGGARPLIKSPSGRAGLQAQGGTPYSGGNYLAVVGLEFYSYTNDPSYPGFTWASGQGLAFLNPTSWLLIEDCKFSFYANGIGFIFPPYGANNVTARRNVVVDNYGNGIFAGGIPSGFLVEENIVDHNGWNAAEARGNALNHNLYLTGATDNPAPVTVRGNIVSNDTAGSQLRSGGIITNNLWIQNPYAHNLGMPTAGVMTIVDNNVYTEAVALGTAYGWGVDVPAPTGYNLGTVTFSNNIMTQTASPTAGLGIRLAAGTTGTLTNNIFFNWQNPVIDQTSGTVTYTGYNLKDAAGANNLGAPEPFPSPGRTVGTYYDSIVGSSGHTSFDFIAAARRQSKDNWNPALMATPVNDYIRAGFGITTNPTTPPPPTPTTDTTAPSVPTGLAATAVSDTQVNLAWTASTDNIGVTGYKIFRNGVQVGTTSSTSYQNTGLAGGTAYSFAVAAYDAAGNASAQSSSVSVTTSATTTSDSPPSVAVVSPKNGSTPNGSINIGVSASSAIGIASITITADGNPLATCMDVTSCSATWQKKKLTRGTHTIRGTAIDKQGKSADASVLVTILR